MSQLDQLFLFAVFAGFVTLNLYGEWYWRVGKGKLKRLKKQRRK